jgi:hypothetical protein
MNTPLPVESPIGGVLWTWILPVLLFATAFVATWLLYRHFSGRGERS